MPTPGEICAVCKRPFYRNEHHDYVNEGCSEFCATQDDDVKAGLQDLKEGDWGIYPCSECGHAIEDVFEPGTWCSSCVKPRAARVRGELLQEALPFLPPGLAERVRLELTGRKDSDSIPSPRYDRDVPID